MLFLSARVKSGRGEPRSALATLRKLYALHKAEPPSKKAPIEMNAIYASLCRAADDKEAAYEGACLVVEQINDAGSGDGYNNDELWFLLYWMRTTLVRLSDFVDSAPWMLALDIPVTFDSLNFERIRPRLRDMFPVTEEWCREEDAYVEANRAVAIS